MYANVVYILSINVAFNIEYPLIPFSVCAFVSVQRKPFHYKDGIQNTIDMKRQSTNTYHIQEENVP